MELLNGWNTRYRFKVADWGFLITRWDVISARKKSLIIHFYFNAETVTDIITCLFYLPFASVIVLGLFDNAGFPRNCRSVGKKNYRKVKYGICTVNWKSIVCSVDILHNESYSTELFQEATDVSISISLHVLSLAVSDLCTN